METRKYLFEKLFKQFLTEQTNRIKFKMLQKDGYEVAPGTIPPDKNAEFDVDDALIVMGQNKSAASMALNAMLRQKNIAIASGLIVTKIDGNNTIARFIKKIA